MLTDISEVLTASIITDHADDRGTKYLWNVSTHHPDNAGSKHLWNLVLIALMMEAVSTSEISVNFYETTRRNIPESCHLLTCIHKNLKSYTIYPTVLLIRPY
jgi:hypothetical protein